MAIAPPAPHHPAVADGRAGGGRPGEGRDGEGRDGDRRDADGRDAELLDEWARLTATIASLEARRAEILHERMERLAATTEGALGGGSVAFRSMTAEFAAAGHLPHTTMEGVFGAAWSLVERYPATLDALRQGTIGLRHAETIVSAGTVIPFDDDARRAEFERRVLPFAESETVARTRVHARGTAAALVPETLAERHQRARAERSVSIAPLDDGLAELRAVLPEVLAQAVYDRLTAIARHVASPRPTASSTDGTKPKSAGPASTGPEISGPKSAGPEGAGPEDTGSMGSGTDDRTFDQIRADALADILLTGDPSAVSRSAVESITATVQVTLSAHTLSGADDRMAELDGHGPLLPSLARELAAGATSWNRLFLDPAGQVVETDAYTPTASMRRRLRARDQHCRFPGCRAPAHRCDADHNRDHAKGGRTTIRNLSLFCRRHHTLKHPDLDDRDRWSAEQLDGGLIRWRSPLGREYVDMPPPRVMFT
ncbi:hypothetical protein J2Y69_003634 [Microbacterium resistens]|uniref:HNH nuclease domain-containing protein n=1 Tax=Microbacterium resistens TaxID=156977 RepID=A0ABU1SHA2_9MICO|nr:DUF222 domain-containing protein [Microbacterium resistens]MDR6869006.1 hypothetical protein [Microbacterium resistens]